MPALYTHTPRATGDIITAVDYNGDHQNHVNNGEAAQLGGYSSNVSQMQTVEDPGTPGSESLPTSIAGELTRLRFTLKQIKTWIDASTTQWYSAMPAAGSWSTEIATMKRTALYTDDTQIRYDTLGVNGHVTNNDSALEWANSVFTILRAWWRVPEHWTPGNDPRIIWWMTPSVVDGNTARMGYDVWRFRLGATPTNLASGTVNVTPVSLNTVNHELDIANANVQVGDMLYFHFYRDGANGADDFTGTMFHSGTFMRYTANAGQI